MSAVELPDGRSLTFYETGDPDGAPVVFHHGTPGSGIPYAPLGALAAELGVRLVAFDRAGYGASTRKAGRSVGDVAGDTAALADALGFERFAAWGHSGGGPHALACAALLPGRVVAAASVAGVAPYRAPGLDWMGGMGEANVAEFSAALAGEGTLRPALETEREGLAEIRGPDVVAALSSLLPPADVAVLTGELGDHLAASFRAALASGVDGWVDDDLAFAAPWGLDVSAIAVPVLVVQGRQDLMVPYAHGEWLAANVRGAEARLADEHGHLTLFAGEPARDVLAWLLARF